MNVAIRPLRGVFGWRVGSMMRLFLALPVPKTERDKLVRLQRLIGRGRFVHQEDLHVTVVFLGDGTVGQVDALVDALTGVDLALPPIKLAGSGVFGKSLPKAAWVGMVPRVPLAALHKKLVRCAMDAGFEVPKRKYVPHITLARFSPGADNGKELAAFFECCGGCEFEPFQPHALNLYQSMLGRTAPIYDALHAFPIRSR